MKKILLFNGENRPALLSRAGKPLDPLQPLSFEARNAKKGLSNDDAILTISPDKSNSLSSDSRTFYKAGTAQNKTKTSTGLFSINLEGYPEEDEDIVDGDDDIRKLDKTGHSLSYSGSTQQTGCKRNI
jgi:hypothetical protein